MVVVDDTASGEGIASSATDSTKDGDATELQANIAQKATAEKAPFDPVVFAQKYVMESCFMAFFVVCFVILFLGKRHNAAIA